MLEGYGGDLGKLDDLKLIRNVLSFLPSEIGLNKISEPLVVRCNAEDESGISGVILMAESHISIHTYPKKNFSVMDVFSCKEFDVDRVIKILKNKFEFNKINEKLILREYEKN